MFDRSRFDTSGAVIWAFCIACGIFLFAVQCFAQSNDISFPTAITENEITGQIKPRDLGDARNTTYYFTFNGRQGDLFVNVVTKNLNGSVDIFSSEGLRPLTNILVYADISQSETGRVIYLRKPEKLILRVQGRTTNDEPAEFQIKFAGGFEAAQPTTEEPPVPRVTDVGKNNSGVRVNSVGTIIEVIPKAKPTPKPVQTETATAKVTDAEEKSSEELKVRPTDEETAAVDKNEPEEKEPTEDKPAKDVEPVAKPPAKSTIKTPSTKAQNRNRSTKTSVDQLDTSMPASKPEPESEVVRKSPKVVVTDSIPKPEPKPNPLANVNLVIIFKDGTKVQRPMTEVTRFTVDQTTLTVVSTNGRITKFSILDVESVTIQ